MSKGDRKRANNKESTPTKKQEVTKCENCKGNCNNTCKCSTRGTSIYEQFPARTLSQTDANKIKELFQMSNNVSALIRDYAEKEITAARMKDVAKQIKKDKQPLLIQVANNMFKTESNYQDLASRILKQADEVEKALKIIKGQIAHRYEDYVSLLIHVHKYLEQIINKAEIKSITGHRSKNKEFRKEEEVLFEKEFDQITNEDRETLKKLLEDRKKEKK